MTTHACPGGCGTYVPRARLSCRPCWYRLPAGLRGALNEAHRTHGAHTAPHRAALSDALDWYRSNPR
jgi:hypothetical protein